MQAAPALPGQKHGSVLVLSAPLPYSTLRWWYRCKQSMADALPMLYADGFWQAMNCTVEGPGHHSRVI